MSRTLHEVYNEGDIVRFKAALASSARRTGGGAASQTQGSSSLSRSPRWEQAGGPGLTSAQLNRLDGLGRTVLHLAVSSPDAARFEYVEALLACPITNVNVRDVESGWTALHRALYHANLAAARALIAHPQIQLASVDNEGLTAFDLYNGTVEGTNPGEGGARELYAWGDNRNLSLGLSTDGERRDPERIFLRSAIPASPVVVSDVSMARHTSGALARLRLD